ncbi:MAG: hypothetical protein CYPHOPRED_003619, partial [Cyphobasidiales sp. Tagirdzhanova-0007]
MSDLLEKQQKSDEVNVTVHHESQKNITSTSEVELSVYQYTKEENRRLVRKFDLRQILPIIWACYLFNSLDRSNVSNAKSDGMTGNSATPSQRSFLTYAVVDLHFPYNGYAIMLSVFYVPFCTLVVPSVMLTRRIGPHWTIPGMMIGWGSMAMVNAGGGSFAGVLIIRILLGTFEAGFAASLIFYLTTFYTRGELSKRIAAFYS